MAIIRNFDEFSEAHAILLANSGIPSSMHQRLFFKLSTEAFDGGDFFEIEVCENGRQKRLLLSGESMEKEADVFLVDHAWSFRLADARKQFHVVLHVSVKILLVYYCNAHNTVFFNFHQNLIALNLWGNKLHNSHIVIEEIKKCRNLRAVWLNENPVLQECGASIADAIMEGATELEIYNSHFTSNYGKWALGFCGGIYGVDNPSSHDVTHPLKDVIALDLSNRCIHTLCNKAFNPKELPSLTHLNLRGNPLDQNSVDDLLHLLKGFTGLQSLEIEIPGPLGRSAIDILESLPRLFQLNGVHALNILESKKQIVDSKLPPRLPVWNAGEPLEDRVIRAMWFYVMTYRLADEEKIDETPVWYMMDELGSALRHSDEPNFRIAPFLFMPEGTLASAVSFSVLWPTQNVHKGEECTRDFLFGIGENKQRSARLTAWFHTPTKYSISEYEKFCQQLHANKYSHPGIKASLTTSILPSNQRSLHVYTDVPQVEEFLTRPEFVITNDPKDADIIWTSVQVDQEMKAACGLTDQQYVNQFPYEACLVMKHHLAETIHQAQGLPEWLQPTYNLETQLPELIGDYHIREEKGLNNLWILKPWNMARTIDTTITSDLPAIIRLMETGPKICQKYIESPALFQGKKFDLRYIVLLRSVQPLDILLFDVFWVRMANNTYTLDKSSLFEYETHFTVMNYGRRLNHMNTPEFVMEFEKEHHVRWLDIHQRVREMLRAVFESAAMVHPEMHNSFSRAMYGVDVMLDSNYYPKLLEVSYCPDCGRACKYDTRSVLGSGEIIKGQDFFNHVFGCLFLNESSHFTPL
ncbi:tubulin--tyrosine ligase-like protein 12 [Amborella trichopoda]|uniref:tubulin--tyrosine ligase-like protein 12 n=1 Tax=Amborella trichopoda TaxID=13333 RepID=UPI0009BCF5C6|nr:tubulin--tyrosine ligase-like protein 12 [Amborella trichopoda]|eukprot:XP_020526121.1 tubulin--tyrosine ligase-like protein 12 [Amborella trichopoda]